MANIEALTSNASFPLLLYINRIGPFRYYPQYTTVGRQDRCF